MKSKQVSIYEVKARFPLAAEKLLVGFDQAGSDETPEEAFKATDAELCLDERGRLHMFSHDEWIYCVWDESKGEFVSLPVETRDCP